MNNDLISRSALKEHIGSYAGMFTDELGFAVSLEAVLRGIDFAPAADVVAVVHGEWTEQHHEKWDDEWDDTIHWYTYECSKCGAVAMSDYPYCPFCGAKMDGERKGDDDT